MASNSKDTHKHKRPRDTNNTFPESSVRRVIDDHGMSREAVEKKELEKAAGDFSKISMKEKQVQAMSEWPTHTFKLFGATICGGSHHGCNYEAKDLLSSIACNTSTSPTTLVESGNKKKKSVQSWSLDPLELSLRHEPWKMKTKLTKSDLGSNCWLVLPKNDVLLEIMPSMDSESKEAIESEGGMGVIVVDMDTESEYNMVFKYLSSIEGYILRKEWTRFVNRRGLKEGDEVGLRWDIFSKKFNISVLHQAVDRHPQAKAGWV